MITYQIDGMDSQQLFINTVTAKMTDMQTSAECDCPLCNEGKVTIVKSTKIKGYMHALCNVCGSGAFN